MILSDKDEVQPDVLLRIKNEYGGQSTSAQYVTGAPELVAEIAQTSKDIDLRIKKKSYQHTGVLEYIVVCVKPLSLHWFDLQGEKALEADSHGIFKSCVFPGLSIDRDALLNLDYDASMTALRAGMESAEYISFKNRLLETQKNRIEKHGCLSCFSKMEPLLLFIIVF